MAILHEISVGNTYCNAPHRFHVHQAHQVRRSHLCELVESFCDENGRPRQRTVSTLGRLDEAGGRVDALLKGLLRAKGMPASMAEPPQLAFESALALGDVWALDQLWKELGFDALAGVFRKARYTTPSEHAIRVMVFNRLCDAE